MALHSSLHCETRAVPTAIDGGCEAVVNFFEPACLAFIVERDVGWGEAKGQDRRGLLIFGGNNALVDFSHALCLYFLEHGFYFRRKRCNSCTLACPKKSMVMYILPEAN